MSRSPLLQRVRRFWARHRTLFWTLHTAWALATGLAVAILARERYELVLWVVAFLALTWASTLFFGRGAVEASQHEDDARRAAERPPGLVHEVTSYLTRIMYQETLFFLLPFYAYSTVVRSPNVGFIALLGILAFLSCIDLLFDRWLRTHAAFALAFFTVVAFAALNLLLPLVFGLGPHQATPLAAVGAVGGTLPLTLRIAPRSTGQRVALALVAVGVLTAAIGFPALVPPVPIRLESATFAPDIDSGTLEIADTLPRRATTTQAGSSLVVLVEVFAPSNLPATVRLQWLRDGETLRVSREIEIVAHATGFRVWDRWRAPSGQVPPGRYQVVLRAEGDRLFGVASQRVVSAR